MTRTTAQFVWSSPPVALGGAKRSNIIKLHSQFQIFFKPNLVCLLTNEIYKTYQTGFLFRRLGHAPGVGHEVLGSKIKFSDHSHVAIQIKKG